MSQPSSDRDRERDPLDVSLADALAAPIDPSAHARDSAVLAATLREEAAQAEHRRRMEEHLVEHAQRMEILEKQQGLGAMDADAGAERKLAEIRLLAEARTNPCVLHDHATPREAIDCKKRELWGLAFREVALPALKAGVVGVAAGVGSRIVDWLSSSKPPAGTRRRR